MSKKERPIWQKSLILTLILVAAAIILAAAGMVATGGEETSEKAEADKGPEVVRAVVVMETEKLKDKHSLDWGAEDDYLLAKLAMAEAEGESTEGKAMVILTVLNRVFDPVFPGTISDVIYAPRQFSPVWESDWQAVEPNEDCWKAVRMVKDGWDESGGATYFEATYNGADTWHSRNLQFIKTVGGHNFYKAKEAM